MGSKNYDVLIVGGGIMGCSVAYHLLRLDPRITLAVIERDPTYERASTTLSMGGIRVQFSLKENILISLHTLEALKTFGEVMAVGDSQPDVGFRREGYLFLIDKAGESDARSALALQKELGGCVEWWEPEKIAERYSLLRVPPFIGATFGPRDGYLDPHSFLMAFRAKAQSLGARFLDQEVASFDQAGAKMRGVKLASGENLSSPIVVNAAGAWSPELAKTVRISLPVEPVKRQVFILKPAFTLQSPLPLVIYPSGFYLRTEMGELLLIGRSFDDDSVGTDFGWDRRRFEDVLWPELVRYAPSFDSLKIVRGWAGLYDVNRLDGNAILGEWPELRGLYLICGFSGHGLQQAPAAGRYIAELVARKPPTLDLSLFGPQRIFDGRPLTEKGLV
jgi:FAD-dependent oxidoreductase domain-containing protein 1